MLNGNYVTVESIFEAVNTTFKGLSIQLDNAEAVEWVGEALEKINVPGQLIDKVTNGDKTLEFPDRIVIENFRGELPNDIFYTVGARQYDTMLPMRRATDVYHMAYHCAEYEDPCLDAMLTYKMNQNYIYTSFEEGEVVLAYKAVPTDEYGVPLIPDNRMYKEAVKQYLQYRIAERLWLQDKFTAAKFQHFEREWMFYVNAAETSARMPDYDEAVSWKNIIQTLIPNVNRHAGGFRYLGTQERRFNSNQSV